MIWYSLIAYYTIACSINNMRPIVLLDNSDIIISIISIIIPTIPTIPIIPRLFRFALSLLLSSATSLHIFLIMSYN